MARPLHAAWALTLSACFTGGFLAGQPCTSDADCGPSLRCEQGVCGGPSGQVTTTTSTASSSDPPTTGAPTTGTTTTSTTTSTTSTSEPLTSTTTTDDATTGGGCGIGRCKDLDILFVADNSPSMLLKTLVLLDFISTFGGELIPEVREACSVHLGVITTDVYAQNPPRCQKLGALVTADHDGDPCMYMEGLPYATLPDLANPLSLECMFNIGSEGSTNEQPIDALFAAIGAKATELNNTCNGGFYRADAFLIVILVTDEDDDNNDAQGNSGSEDLLETLWDETLKVVKPTGIQDLYMVGVLGDPKPGDPACMWDPEANDDGLGTEATPKLRAFIQSLPEEHHALGTLCNVVPGGKAYVPLMQEIRADIGQVCGA